MNLDETIATTLEKHTADERVARTWRVSSKAHGGAYWFDVTWIPGSLTLTGDLDSMIVTHYQALRECNAGIEWIAGSDDSYLLGKSSARQDVLDRRATAKYLVDNALSALRSLDLGPWKKLQREWGHWRGEKAKPRELIEFIADDDLLDSRRIFELGMVDDYYGTFVYSDQARWQIAALKKWAELMMATWVPF